PSRSLPSDRRANTSARRPPMAARIGRRRSAARSGLAGNTAPTPGWRRESPPITSGRMWPRSRRRSMIRSPAKPRPVSVGRDRYSKLGWRLLVHALDAVGALLSAIVRRFRPDPTVTSPRRILVVQLDHLGDAVLSTPLLAELRTAHPAAAIDVLASPSNHEV